MKIIKLENQKNDSFFEAECFLHIGEAEEDKNYVAFDLRREDDPLYSCSYYDFEKEKGDKIFHCFDGQDYSWKCYENEVTNDEKLKNEIDYLKTRDRKENIKIKILEADLHEANDVKRVMNNIIAGFKGQLQTIPYKLAPLIIGVENLGELQEIISDNINSILKELSEYDRNKFIKNKEYIIEDDEEEE